MATRTLRRGLPRTPGGEPWPPAGDAPVAVVPPDPAEAGDSGADTPAVGSIAAERSTSGATTEAVAPEVTVAEPAVAPASAPGTGASQGMRRGLPRTPGGEPWPPAGAVPLAAAAADAAPAVIPEDSAVSPAPTGESASAPEAGERAGAVAGVMLRRGLPRTPGGDPWPPAGTVAVAVEPASTGADAAAARPDAAASTPAALTTAALTAEPSDAPAAVATIDVSTPLPFTRTVFPGKNAMRHLPPKPEPERIGPFTKAQWAGTVILGGAALLGAAAMAVVLVRWLLSFGALQDFIVTYPGEYHLPDGAPVGFPAWLGWQHFFNVFLMVLIIRSGLRIRTEKRPTAFWTPRGNPKGKVSLTIWFHQALDILWLLNGAVFIVLLFITGQWMRVIPTSWEVFPNAFSAVLQYISLDWPTENGWANYNSIQQIAYFATIFLAAPLAAATGFRMSGMWPKNAAKLNKLYPIEWARAVHFPVMLYFVAFIAVHVFLVLATGALRNLNHMYAAQGSTDPTAYASNWTGFWFFIASLVVIAAAWVAARPLVLAPIAKLFGTVSGR